MRLPQQLSPGPDSHRTASRRPRVRMRLTLHIRFKIHFHIFVYTWNRCRSTVRTRSRSPVHFHANNRVRECVFMLCAYMNVADVCVCMFWCTRGVLHTGYIRAGVFLCAPKPIKVIKRMFCTADSFASICGILNYSPCERFRNTTHIQSTRAFSVRKCMRTRIIQHEFMWEKTTNPITTYYTICMCTIVYKHKREREI